MKVDGDGKANRTQDAWQVPVDSKGDRTATEPWQMDKKAGEEAGDSGGGDFLEAWLAGRKKS